MMTTKELILTVTDITKENISQVDKWMHKLSEKQLNWRPNPGIWSVAEVLAHLNSYSRYYHPAFKSKIENTRFVNAKDEFVSSPLGRSAWKSMKLGRLNNVKRKFKAPKGHNPTIDPNMISGSEVADFKKNQDDLIEIFELSSQVNLRKVKVPISISKIVRLKLGDALLFVVYHNQRHMQQILKLKNSPNFPRK
ncbi:MAG: putative damage-inducible protein DinB [Flavobacteriaceae bacterium]|jgi:uncharacterized damage-inducible protein DinB